MRIGSLFSGYGGLDLAVQSVLGGEVAWHVEYDKAPSRILDHHFPGVPNYGDVTKLDFTTVEPVDVLTGGYPCQPFSHAGLRKGTDDDRHLWPHVLRAIREMGPRLAVLENVRGHLSLGFDTVLSDLASVGWSARWGVVRASDAGACHQRARLFIVAYPSGDAGGERRGLPGVGGWSEQAEQTGVGDWRDAADADRERREQHHQGERLLQVTNQDSDDATSNPSRQRYGRGQVAGMVGRLGAAAEVIGRQTSPARSQSGDRGSATAADADDTARLGRVQPRLGPRDDAAGRGQGDSPTWHPHSDDAPPLRTGHQQESQPGRGGIAGGTNWGDYSEAIARWQRVTGRPAPPPTEPARSGAPRLSPAFVEWMMGLPAGWVTDPAIGISRNDQLKALGNGVVPQQAALALDVLLKGTPNDLTQSLATV